MAKYRSTLEKQLQHEQLSEYESTLTLTALERQLLRQWVRYGNDVISNPWHYGNDGWELDFITALRIDLGIYELRKRMAEES